MPPIFTPIHYLIEKFIDGDSDSEPSIDQVLEQARAILKAQKKGRRNV